MALSWAGYLYLYPCKANYLGGDIISGVAASGMINSQEICVFLDIGTNGELVVGNQDFLLCGAGAAGPALEGGVVKTRHAGRKRGCVRRASGKRGICAGNHRRNGPERDLRLRH